MEFKKVMKTARPSTYTRMSRMGLLGVAEATTLAGEFTVAPFPGLETVSGKDKPEGGGGSGAGGAGKALEGVHIGVGEAEGPGVADGLGAGSGDGVGPPAI